MSERWRNTIALIYLGVGLMAGFAVAAFWPSTPLHATATDRCDTFAIATGFLDDKIEAIFLLDFLTGDLKAAAVSRANGKFNCFYTCNINADMGVDPSKNPHYLMTTGIADLISVGGAHRPQPQHPVRGRNHHRQNRRVRGAVVGGGTRPGEDISPTSSCSAVLPFLYRGRPQAGAVSGKGKL